MCSNALLHLLSQWKFYITRTLSRDNSLSRHDLDLWPTQMEPPNGISTHDGKQFCKFMLKSIQNYRSYGSDKNLTFKCDLDLDLGPTCMNVSNGTSTHDREQSCQITLKSIHNCRSYGPDKFGWTDGHMHRRMHIHWTVVVTIVSFTASRINKNISLLRFI